MKFGYWGVGVGFGWDEITRMDGVEYVVKKEWEKLSFFTHLCWRKLQGFSISSI
jgi:hypothetical protein